MTRDARRETELLTAYGDVIVLNGSSSAGVTAIAGTMQKVSGDQYWLHSGTDHFLHRMSLQIFRDPDWAQICFDSQCRLISVTLQPKAHAFFCAIYHAIAAFARAGVSVIVDDVLYDETIVSAMVETLAPFHPLMVGVRCPLDVACERERARGDRAPGGAEVFHSIAHRFTNYALEIDSSLLDPAQAAAAILAARKRPRAAFMRMRDRLAK